MSDTLQDSMTLNPITVESPIPLPPPEVAVSVPGHEEFEYGYRYARELQPNGEMKLIYVPLTREDVIHPQEDDVILHNDPHQVMCDYLYDVFRAQLRADATAVVFQDTGVFWDVPGLGHHSPDVTVILGVREQKGWRSFYVEEEGVRPAMVLEVTSPSTRTIDLEEKYVSYGVAGVPIYVIVETDPVEGTVPLRLLGYQLTADGYALLQADERGWLWLEPVQLWLGITAGKVCCYNAGGERLGDYSEVTQAYTEVTQAYTEVTQAYSEVSAALEAESRARAEAEQQAAEAHARLRELEEELKRLRGQ